MKTRITTRIMLAVKSFFVLRPLPHKRTGLSFVPFNILGYSSRATFATTITRIPPPPKSEKPSSFSIKGGSLPKGTSISDDDDDAFAPKQQLTRAQLVLQAIDKKNQKRAQSKLDPAAVAQQQQLLAQQNAKPIEQKLTEKFRVNLEINDVQEAICVAPEGALGKLPFAKIWEEATKRKLDLVEVVAAPQEVVIKLMDFKAFVEEKKQARKQREALMGTQPKDLEEPLLPLKEIQIGTNIEHHDFEMKKGHMRKFLEKKHPVKLTIKMKKSTPSKGNTPGPQKAQELIARVLSDLGDVIAIEKTKQDAKPVPGSIVKFFYPKKDEVTKSSPAKS